MPMPTRTCDLVNAQRSAAGWVTTRDSYHGRVVDRQPVVAMALTCNLDTVVNGRAADPDPRAPARVSAFSPMVGCVRVRWARVVAGVACYRLG